MAFFQDLGKHLSDAAQTVGKRTSEAAEIARLNGKLAGIRDQIDELFSQIGKAYYATREAQSEHEAASRLCSQIDELEASAQSIDRMIDRIKRQRRCPNCGGIQPSQSRFCASCGSKLPEEELFEPEAVTAEPVDEAEEEPDRAVVHDKADVNVEINWPEPRKPEAPAEDGEEAINEDD